MPLPFIQAFKKNALQSFKKDAIISRIMSAKYTIIGGSVIQLPPFKNELKYNPNTWAEWSGSSITKDSTGLTLTVATSGYAIVNTNLKTNTKYGVLVNIVTNTLSAPLYNTTDATSSVQIAGTGQTGNFKAICTSLASISTNKFGISVVASGSVKIRDFRLYELPPGSEIESDFTNKTADELSKKYPFNPNQIKGALSAKVSGLTAVNGIQGNFTSTASWTQTNTTLTVASNEGTFTATAQNAKISQSYTTISGHKYYVRAWISGATTNSLTASNGIGTKSKTIAGYELVSFIGTANASSAITIDISDSAASGWATTKAKQAMIIDLTAISQDTLTQAQCDNTFLKYWDGIGSVPPTQVRSVGKNLFDKSKAIFGKYLGSTDTENTYASLSYSDYIRIPVNTNITFSGMGNVGTVVSKAALLYDVNKRLISTVNAIVDNTSYSFSTGNAQYIRLNIMVSNLSMSQLELGSTATAYEPYTEKIVGTPVELKHVGTVKDEFNFDTWVNTKRNEEKVLQSSDITELITTKVNNDYIKIPMPTGGVTRTTENSGMILTDFSIPALSAYVDDVSAVGKHYYGSTSFPSDVILYVVAKGTYANLAAAQTALAGKKLVYQLANPQIKDYSTLMNMLYPKGLTSEKNGTVYIEALDGSALSIVPTIELQYEVAV